MIEGKIYVSLCEICAKKLWGRPLHSKYKKKAEDGRCDGCEKHVDVHDAHRYGIRYSWQLMDDISYNVINWLSKRENVIIQPKEEPQKLVFWKDKAL